MDTVGVVSEPKLIKTIDTEVVGKQTKEETVVENTTPDYAVGFVCM